MLLNDAAFDDLFDRPQIAIHAEAGLWGSIRHHDLLSGTVILSDDGGRLRVGNHALCRVHHECLLQKLLPRTGRSSTRSS